MATMDKRIILTAWLVVIAAPLAAEKVVYPYEMLEEAEILTKVQTRLTTRRAPH